MKLNVQKSINAGQYVVYFAVTELSPIEHKNLVKFGAPEIDLEGKLALYQGKAVRKLPVHAIKHRFSFSSQAEADKFEETIAASIKEAAAKLRELKDTFSRAEEYEI